METSVKVKATIIILSVMVIAMVHIFRTNFFRTPVIKEWSELQWDDFRGIPKPFSSFDAAISSKIYLSYDSVSNRYIAFAGQNNLRSWANNNRTDYGLTHEQYHFNITEVHARLMNKYIRENPEAGENVYRVRLSLIDDMLSDMQGDYDSETDHSVNYDRQKYWEHKLDSLLRLDSGWVTDEFTGARAYFPRKPVLTRGLSTNGTVFRKHQLQRFDMILTLLTYQYPSLKNDALDQILSNYQNADERIAHVAMQKSNDTFGDLYIVSTDTNGFTSYNKWVRVENNLYHVMVQLPKNLKDSTGFDRVAKSFISSFSVVNTDSMWIRLHNTSSVPVKVGRTLLHGAEFVKGDRCMIIKIPEKNAVVRSPIWIEDGSVILPFDNIVHNDSLVGSYVARFNNTIYETEAPLFRKYFFLSRSTIPSKPFVLDVGYLLKPDSAAACMPFFREQYMVTPVKEQLPKRRQ